MAQTLNVLLWKTLILRKRRWIITLLEIAIPILLFYLLVYLQNLALKHNGPDSERSAMEDIDLEEATLDNHTLRDRHPDTALLSARLSAELGIVSRYCWNCVPVSSCTS
ncbi:hypothetical protein J6590_077316 [Homalodisca vitripennis]|nr:hypothetical protein J6590_077316 [Homalodisca vitripennis]